MFDRMSERFFKMRKLLEEHALDRYFVLGNKTNFVILMATGFIGDHYYMPTPEIVAQTVYLHREISNSDLEFHKTCLEVFRTISFIKDQVLIGIAFQFKHKKYDEDMLNLLLTFPPSMILRLIKILRSGVAGVGYSSYAKKMIKKVIESWPVNRFEYYAMRYPKQMRTILKLTHPKLSGMHHDIAGWLLARKSKRKAPTERLKVFEEITKISDPIKRIDLILNSDYLFPFEVLRSRAKKDDIKKYIDAVGIEKFTERLMKIISPNAFAFNLRYIASFVPDELLAKYAAEKIESGLESGTLSLFEVARAVVVMKKTLPETAKVMAKIYEKHSEKILDALLPGLETPKLVAVVDASGSMFFQNLRHLLPLLVVFKKFVTKIITFDEEATLENIEKLDLFNIDAFYDYLEHTKGGGTNIAAALELALSVSEPDEVILLFTDEQENAKHEGLQANDVIKNKNNKLIILNASPYPARAFNLKEKNILGVPVTRPETLIAALRMMQLYNLKDEEVKEYVLKLVAKRIKRKKKK